eukprot:1455692-Alexandrium_andersonii.AAC.1
MLRLRIQLQRTTHKRRPDRQGLAPPPARAGREPGVVGQERPGTAPRAGERARTRPRLGGGHPAPVLGQPRRQSSE